MGAREDLLRISAIGYNDYSLTRGYDIGGFGGGPSSFGADKEDWQKYQLNQLRHEAKQAIAKGYLPADAMDEIEDRSSLVQKILFLNGEGANNSGSALESIIDVLSIGGYVSAGYMDAITKSQLADPGEEIYYKSKGKREKYGGFVDSWVESYRNKQSVSDYLRKYEVFGDSERKNFWFGLGGDILLDPTTYLTFGVAPGAKVLVKGGKAVNAAKAGERTLNKFGTKIYRLAAEDLAPGMYDEVGGHLLDKTLAPAYHQRVTDYMVDNFDALRDRLIQKDRVGYMSRLGERMGALEVKGMKIEDKISAIKSNPEVQKFLSAYDKRMERFKYTKLDDAFEETAGAFKKEFGVNTKSIQTSLAYAKLGDVDLGRPFRAFFDAFDRGWDIPDDVMEVVRAESGIVSMAMDEANSRYRQVFGKLSQEQRESVSEIIEARALRESGVVLSAGMKYSPEIEEAVALATKEFDDILRKERSLGFEVGNVEGYVSHIYKTRPNDREMALEAIRRNGEEIYNSTNQYTQHRLIASIAEGTELYGKDALERDIYNILNARKRASLEMIHKDRIYKHIVKNHGLPAAIIEDMTKGVPGGLIRGFIRRYSQGTASVVDVSQSWSPGIGRLTELGFDPSDVGKNADIIELMSIPRTDRITGAFAEKIEKHGLGEEVKAYEFLEESAQKVEGVSGVSTIDVVSGSPAKRYIDVKLSHRKFVGGVRNVKSGEIREVNIPVHEAYKMLTDDKHPGWGTLFVGGGAAYSKMIRNLDEWSRKYVQAPIRSIAPDMETVASRAYERHLYEELRGKVPGRAKTVAAIRAKEVKQIEYKVEKLRSSIQKIQDRRELKVTKWEPQLPPTLVGLADKLKKNIGIRTSERPSSEQLALIEEYKAKIGFDAETWSKFLKAATGEETITSTSYADKIEDILSSWADFAGYEKRKFANRPTRYVKVGLRFSKQADGIIPELKVKMPKESELSPGKSFAEVQVGDGNEIARSFGQAEPIDEILRKKEPLYKKPHVDDFSDGDREFLKGARKLASELSEIKKVEKMLAAEAKLKKNSKLTPDTRSAMRKDINKRKKSLSGDIENANVYLKSVVEAVDKNGEKIISPDGRGLRVHKEFIKVLDEFGETYDGFDVVPGAMITGPDVLDRSIARVPGSTPNIDKAKLAESKGYAFDQLKGKQEFSEGRIGEVAARSPRIEDAVDNKSQIIAIKKKLEVLKSERSALLKNPEATKAEKSVVFQNIKRYNTALRNLKSTAIAKDYASEIRSAKAMAASSSKMSKELQGAIDLAESASSARRSIEAADRARLDADTGFDVGYEEFAKDTVYDVYLPDNIVRLLKDLEAPSVPSHLPEIGKKILVKYDQFTRFTKAQLMSPHGGFHMRNFYGNAAMTAVANGLEVLRPGRAETFTKAIYATLMRHTSIGEIFGIRDTELGAIADKFMLEKVVADNGRETTIGTIIKEAQKAGVFTGFNGGEILKDLALSSRVSGAVGGASAGIALGAVGGAVASTEEDGLGWSSIVGGALGGILGGRKFKGIRGTPVPDSLGRVTRMMQTGWHPMLRIGEAATEIPFRLATYTNAFLKNGSHSEARKAVYAHFNDNFALSAAERRVIRRIVPFYQWTKLGITSFMHQAINNPGRLSSMFDVVENLNAEHDYDPEDIPDFFHDKLSMLIDANMDGKADSIRPLNFTNVEEVAAIASAFSDKDSLVKELGSRGPLGVSGVVEWFAGRDFFTGASLDKSSFDKRFSSPRDYETAPGWMKQLVGYRPATSDREAQINPKMAHLLSEVPGSRFISVAKSIIELDDEGIKKVNWQALSRELLGTSVYRIDPETNKYYVNKRKIDDMSKMLKAIGYIRKYDVYKDVEKGDTDYRRHR